MYLAISSYSYSRKYNEAFSILDAIKHSAETGYKAFEFTDLTPPENISVEDYALQLKQACSEAGLSVCSYTVYADFLNGSNGDIAVETERVKGQVRIAALLGAPVMRHDATWGYERDAGKTYKDAITAIAPHIRAVTEYAADINIRTMCENHGYMMQDSKRMVELVKTVNHPNFGLLTDIGNFICADENSLQATKAVAKYTFHAHVKDFITLPDAEEYKDCFKTRNGTNIKGTIPTEGVIPVAECIRALKKNGYDDALSLEYEGEEETLASIKLAYNSLCELI